MKKASNRLLLCALLLALTLLAACKLATLHEPDFITQTTQTEYVMIELGDEERHWRLIIDNRFMYYLEINFRITNHTSKTISGVKTVLTFADMFGEEVYTGTFSFTNMEIIPDTVCSVPYYQEIAGTSHKSASTNDAVISDRNNQAELYYILEDYGSDALRLIDYQLIAVAYTDGSFERFD